MPKFSTCLPANSQKNGYDIRRTPADKPIHGIITSDLFYVVETHYFGGRTMPCEGLNCKACNANSPTRAHVYTTVYEAKTHDHFLYEITAIAAVPLDQYLRANGTLRGCEIKAHRPKRCKNGRVEIVTRPHDLTGLTIPQAPDIPRALCVIWRVPTDAIQTNPEDSNPTILTPKPDAIEPIHDPSGNHNNHARRFSQEELTQCSRIATP